MMAQSLDASVSSLMCAFDVLSSLYLLQSYMSVPYCMTVPNSSGWNSFLTSCPLCLFEEFLLCVQYNLFYVLVLFCWTVKSDGDCQLIPPVHKVSFLSLFLVFGLDLLCLFVVWYHPFPQGLRETGNVFQLLKLNQTVSHACGNFSNVFVAELVVLASVNLMTTIGRSASSLVLPGSIVLEWLALC
jgi:hypothetical protein